jgi:glycerate dehydrogenase
LKLVVLDGHTLNPGDLSWQGLRAIVDCDIHDRCWIGEVASLAKDAELILTNKVAIPRTTLEKLPKLQYIGVTATGYNMVDVEAARERGVIVANVPTYGTRSVAQMVFAHLLNLTQRVGDHAQSVRARRWAASPDFCYWDYPLIELEGLTLGVVGHGRIGRAVAELARAFGMRVLAYSRSKRSGEGVGFVDLETLLRTSDVVSLHCPLTPETEKIIDRERLALMKPTAFLVNTSRGGLIDEAALADALNAERLAGAGLDVLSHEPPPAEHPLYAAKNCYITPHNAWATRASRARLLQATIDNVAAFLAGQPRNVVN